MVETVLLHARDTARAAGLLGQQISDEKATHQTAEEGRWRRKGFQWGNPVHFQAYYLEWENPTIFPSQQLGPSSDRFCVGFWMEGEFSSPFQRFLAQYIEGWTRLGNYTFQKVITKDQPEGYPLGRVCHYRYSWPPNKANPDRYAFGLFMVQHRNALGDDPDAWCAWMDKRIAWAKTLKEQFGKG